MNPRDAILNWLNVPTEPTNVQKAPESERRKRGIWMVASTVLSFTAALTVAMPLSMLLNAHFASWIATVVVGIPLFALWICLDVFVVFPWGVERFDLVPPWQFRGEEADHGE